MLSGDPRKPCNRPGSRRLGEVQQAQERLSRHLQSLDAAAHRLEALDRRLSRARLPRSVLEGQLEDAVEAPGAATRGVEGREWERGWLAA